MPEQMTHGEIVKEIYDTVNLLNKLVKAAAMSHNLVIQYDILIQKEAYGPGKYPHVDLAVLKQVEY